METESSTGPYIVSKSERPRILLCASEMAELPKSMGYAAEAVKVKSGGLGDVTAALAQQLHENSNFEFHAVLPKFDRSLQDLGKISHDETLQLKKVLKKQNVHLIDHPAFSHAFADGSKVNIYGDNDVHCAKMKALAYQAGVGNCYLEEINPDIVHCNDWPTGLIPPLARIRGIKSLFTLHNIFTKKMSPWELFRDGIDSLKLDENLFFENHPESVENNFYQNSVDFTTTGIFASDYFNTVSPRFLEEIVGGMFPERVPEQMGEQIRAMYRAGKAEGILNAPRDSESPENGEYIIPYDISNFEKGKRRNKANFQKKMGLRQDPDIPLYLWPHRLDEQKGIEQLIPEIDHLVSTFGIQIAFVGDGKKDYEEDLGEISFESGGMVSYSDFSKKYEELGMAASDFLLMPSIYEPCGIPQTKCKRYGTVPVVTDTGGLADTVEKLDAYNDRGSGFPFEVADREGFEYAIGSSLEGFYNLPREIKHRNQERIMREGSERHSLRNTAERYLKIYEKLVSEAR